MRCKANLLYLKSELIPSTWTFSSAHFYLSAFWLSWKCTVRSWHRIKLHCKKSSRKSSTLWTNGAKKDHNISALEKFPGIPDRKYRSFHKIRTSSTELECFKKRRNLVWIKYTSVWDPDVFGLPGSRPVSQRYGSGSFPFHRKVLSGLKQCLRNKILTQNFSKKYNF